MATEKRIVRSACVHRQADSIRKRRAREQTDTREIVKRMYSVRGMEKERGKTLYFRSLSIANENVFHGIKITAAFFRHPTLTTDSIFFRARFDRVSSMRSYSLALNRGDTEEKNSYRNVFESDENGTIFICTFFPWKVKI